MIRDLPGDIQAERAILGGILLDYKLYHTAASKISAQDFQLHSHQLIYKAITKLMEDKAAVDYLMVKVALQKEGKLEEAGGLVYIATMSEGIPVSLNIESYCNVVREKARLRSLIALCDATMGECLKDREPVDAIIEAHETTIRKIHNIQNDGLYSLSESISATYDGIQERYADKRKVTGIPSGIHELDELTTGFHGGDLIVISAKTGFGKTAFALNAATYSMVTNSTKTVIFSLEMTRKQLCTRIISAHSGVDSYRMRTGYLTPDDWERIAKTSDLLSNCRSWIHDKSCSIGELDSLVRRVDDEHKIDLLVVDYLQLVSVAGKRFENRVGEVTEVSRRLKAIATDLNIPVIALSQLNADGEVRESRAIEHDASLFIAIEMKLEDLKTLADVPAEIHVRKNRNGSLGRIEGVFRKSITKFEGVKK
jgi:replicative DNA helicase